MAQYLPSTSSLDLCYIILDRLVSAQIISVPLPRKDSRDYNANVTKIARILMSWTLVCRAWVQPCRELLLGDVSLMRPEQAETFLDLLHSPHCTIRPFITCLRIDPPGSDGSWATTTMWDLAKSTLPFRDLRTVSLEYRNCIPVDIACHLSIPLQTTCDLNLKIQNPDEFSHVAHLLTGLHRLTELRLEFQPDNIIDWLVEDPSWKELLPPQSLEKLTTRDSSTPLILEWLTSHVPENLPKHLSDISLHRLGLKDTHLVSSLLQGLGPAVKNLLLQASDYLRFHRGVRASGVIGISSDISLDLLYPMLTFILSRTDHYRPQSQHVTLLYHVVRHSLANMGPTIFDGDELFEFRIHDCGVRK